MLQELNRNIVTRCAHYHAGVDYQEERNAVLTGKYHTAETWVRVTPDQIAKYIPRARAKLGAYYRVRPKDFESPSDQERTLGTWICPRTREYLVQAWAAAMAAGYTIAKPRRSEEAALVSKQNMEDLEQLFTAICGATFASNFTTYWAAKNLIPPEELAEYVLKHSTFPYKGNEAYAFVLASISDLADIIKEWDTNLQTAQAHKLWENTFKALQTLDASMEIQLFCVHELVATQLNYPIPRKYAREIYGLKEL